MKNASARIGDHDTTIHHHASSNDPLAAAFDEYLRRCEAGQQPDRKEFLSRFPELRSELEDCLTGLEFMERVGPKLCDESMPPPSTTSSVAALSALGDFRIVAELGRGGMGVVYEAEQLSLGRRVALKVLPFASLLDKQQLERFRNEVRAAAMLKHPHIVSVYQTGCERGVHYYAMELIEGQTLADHIESLRRAKSDDSDGAPSSRSGVVVEPNEHDTVPIAALTTHPTARQGVFRNVARLGRQAAAALEHAHRQGVIHRDIKPSNLLLDAAGDLCITDFGLARVQQTGDLTLTGDLIGTLRYMSPEQVDDARVVDARGDVYSLGVTLYELLTLRAAHPQTRRVELTRSIVESEPLALRKIDPAIPRDLETIVQTAMAKEVSQRYRSMQELADDLDRFLNRQSIHATPPTRLDRAAKWLQRNQMFAWLIATAMLVFACVASFGWLREGQLRRENERANANLRTALQSVFSPSRELQLQVDPVIVSAMASQSLETMDRLRPQVPEEMRQEFNLQYGRLLVIRAITQMFQGELSLADAARAERILTQCLPGDGAALWLGEAYSTQAANYLMDLRTADSLAVEAKRIPLADLYQHKKEPNDRAWLHGQYAQALRFAGQIRDAENECQSAIMHARAAEEQVPQNDGRTASFLVRREWILSLLSFRQWDDIRREIDEFNSSVMPRFEGKGLLFDYSYATYRLSEAQVANMQGAPHEAIRILEELVEQISAARERTPSFAFYDILLTQCNVGLSDAYALSRQWEDAERAAREAIRHSRTRSSPERFPLAEARARNRLGHILYAMDRQGHARVEFERAIQGLESICSKRTMDPIGHRSLLGVVATCPFDDLRDEPKHAHLLADMASDETGWFRSVLALTCFRKGKFDQAIEIADQSAGHQGKDAILGFVSAMAYAELGRHDTAHSEFDAAQKNVAEGKPVLYASLYGGISPCVVERLRAEAAELLFQPGDLNAEGGAAETRHINAQLERPHRPTPWPPDIILNH